MSERFVKLHGLGNDFILLDRRAGGGPPPPEQVVRWCERRRGVGADGVLTLLPGSSGRARMRVTNADGSHAEMCGNGLRCVAKYLGDLEPGLAEVEIETDAGLRRCQLLRRQGRVVEVVAEMGAPELERGRIPMAGAGRFVRGQVELEGGSLVGTAVSMGNPHLVLFDTPPARAAELGPRLEHHPLFPARTNVEFVTAGPAGLEVVVWERGCGLTQACGTGACATAVAAVLEGRLPAGREVQVRLPGGPLGITVAPDLGAVRMRGEAVEVFRGELELPGPARGG